MLIADNLQTIRKFYRMSQSQLATMLNVGQPYIALIENGSRPLTNSLRERTMQALELTPSKLQSILDLDAEYKRKQSEIKI